jgi:hypothetical protein
MIGEKGPEAVVPLNKSYGKIPFEAEDSSARFNSSQPEIHLHFHFEGPIYSVGDFKRVVMDIVRDAGRKSQLARRGVAAT